MQVLYFEKHRARHRVLYLKKRLPRRRRLYFERHLLAARALKPRLAARLDRGKSVRNTSLRLADQLKRPQAAVDLHRSGEKKRKSGTLERSWCVVTMAPWQSCLGSEGRTSGRKAHSEPITAQ